VWGSQVLATDHTYDYTLFSVGDFPAIEKFGYLTLDTARPAREAIAASAHWFAANGYVSTRRLAAIKWRD